MKKIVVAGRWGGNGEHRSGGALEEIRRGILDVAPGARVRVLPFGPGPTWDEAVVASSSSASFVRVPLGASSTRRYGSLVREHAASGGTVVVEGGHGEHPDYGLGFLSGLLARSAVHACDSSLEDALNAAEEFVSRTGVDLICSASTARPLLGLDSVLAVAPDLSAVDEQDAETTALLTRVFARHPHRRELLAGPQAHPARAYGSGAGGGVGAVVAAIGGRIVATGDLLARLTPLEAQLEEADLLIVAEPELASPLLAESTVDALTNAAATRALPVVGLTRRSSLSRVERAQWGLHGVFETEGSITLEDAGRRIARTWLR
ncbi:glycerate kinase [Schaalia meyeri]|uniref:glycerate kinase n=1 Tax=Schaalia meyeri TaxID=52773 RepID=UPI00204468E0|nr:glycerate kinase [Schaalia meyeri]